VRRFYFQVTTVFLAGLVFMSAPLQGASADAPKKRPHVRCQIVDNVETCKTRHERRAERHAKRIAKTDVVGKGQPAQSDKQQPARASPAKPIGPVRSAK